MDAPECPTPELLDIPTLAARLKVSVGHIRYLVRHQRIPYVRWGRLVRFDPRRIDLWLDANTQSPYHPDDDGGALDGQGASQERP